jgi:O-antigen/teichoic acid export membrane protein
MTLRQTADLPKPGVSLKTMLAFMAPLAVMGAITIGNMRVSNFMLKTLASPEAVANFELAYQIGFVFPLLTGAMITVLLPRVSAMESRAELRSYRTRLLRMYPIVIPLTLLGVLVGPWFISLVFGAKYAASLAIIRILIIGFGIHIVTHPMSLVFYAVSRPVYLTAIYLAQFALIVVLNFLFIPRWDGLGAALALLVATLAAVSGIIVVSGWVIREPAAGTRDS